MESQVVIDPDGKAIITCGKFSIRVSPDILSMVSPVFCAMFKPNFQEGAILAKGTAIVPIHLPDEDPEIFIIFCNVVHHRSNHVPSQPTPMQLCKMAVLIDKYDCGQAVRPWGIVWLGRKIRGLATEDLCQLLVFAYALDLPQQFSYVSKEVLFAHSGPPTDLPLIDNTNILPQNLLGEFEVARHVMHESLTRALMTLLARFAEYRCDGVLARAGYYVYSLQQLRILPGTESYQSKDITQILDIASNLGEHHRERKCGSYSCQCGRFELLEQGTELSRQLKAWDDATFGMCLDCLRSDGLTLVEKKCRSAPHLEIR